MLKLTHYYYRDEEAPKLFLSLDWFRFEDHWSQRYMFDRAMWNDEMMERMRISNLNRCEWFRISLNLFHYRVTLDLKLKKIGNIYHGRVMDDNPKPSPFKRKQK